MKVLPHVSAKKKTKRLKGFKFRTFIGRFEVTSSVAPVKGLVIMVTVTIHGTEFHEERNLI